MILITTIVLTSFMFLCVLIALTINFRLLTYRSRQIQDKMLFTYDSKEKIIRRTNTSLNKSINKYIWPGSYDDKRNEYEWISLDDFLASFKGTPAESKIRNILFKCSKSDKKIFQEFVVDGLKWAHNKKIRFYVRGKRLSNERFVNLFIVWEPKAIEVSASSQIPEVEINSIIRKKPSHVTLIGIRLNDLKDAWIKFINILDKVIDRSYIKYEYVRNNVIIIFYGDKDHVVKRNSRKIVNLIENRGDDLGINHLIDSSAIFSFSNMSSKPKYLKATSFLEYLIDLSSSKHQPFITTGSKHYRNDDAHKFVELGSKFRDSIRLGNIVLKQIPVKMKGKSKTIANWLQPVAEGVPLSYHNYFIKNKWYRASLIDASVKKFSTIENKIPALIDVGEDWLLENNKTLKNKKAIYIVNLHRGELHENISYVINRLTKKGFVFGLRIKTYNEETSNFISSNNIKCIIVDETLSRDPYNPNIYIDIISVNKIAKPRDIRLIFENPIDYYDTFREKQIGFKFYYNYSY